MPAQLGWSVLTGAWRLDRRATERVTGEIDGLLQLAIQHVDSLAGTGGPGAERIGVFCRAELERLQHATAAALVAQRYGAAGLQTVLEDRAAPRARRYFALVAAAERHPPKLWPLFERYLAPGRHHAFQAAAVEASRFYPDRGPSSRLVELFETIRGDLHLRTFLSPKILESLFVLSDRRALSFLQSLLVVGHTHPDPEWCEVMRALVIIRRLTGHVMPSTKYEHPDRPAVRQALDAAERVYARSAAHLHPVSVI